MFLLSAGVWFAVQVTPQSELRVASHLEYKGYEIFAPTYLMSKRWSDRIKVLEKPLFPGYVFVRTPAVAVSGLVSSTPGVVRILSFGGRPAAVPDFEIDAVRKVMLVGKPQPTSYFNVGQKVEIKDGPFAGVMGIIREIKKRDCLVISVQMIAQSICIDINEFQLGPFSPSMSDTNYSNCKLLEKSGNSLSAGLVC